LACLKTPTGLSKRRKGDQRVKRCDKGESRQEGGMKRKQEQPRNGSEQRQRARGKEVRGNETRVPPTLEKKKKSDSKEPPHTCEKPNLKKGQTFIPIRPCERVLEQGGGKKRGGEKEKKQFLNEGGLGEVGSIDSRTFKLQEKKARSSW